MLSDHNSPLTRRQAAHLLRRACASAEPDRVAAATGRMAREVVEEWLAEPLQTSLFPSPYWLYRFYPPTGASDEDIRDFNDDNQYYVQEVRERWIRDLLSGSIRARMTLFWHNHFVTDVRKYRYGVLAYNYVQRLTLGALGNFRSLTRGFVQDGSMLYYLDGRFNRRNAPNENFARELLELFTMGPFDRYGQPNYTQDDIVDAARAFTGWTMNVRASWSSAKASNNYDGGEKTIFGQTGLFDHNDVIDLIFEEKGDQVAWYMAGKLLEEFVYAEPDENVIDDLAQRIRAHDFEMGPILADLFSSEAFFEPHCEGVRIKSPIEYLLLDISAYQGSPSAQRLVNLTTALRNLGQELLSPPNVAGWPGHHAWLSTDSLPERWNSADNFLNTDSSGIDYWEIMAKYIEPGATHPAVSMAINLAESVFAVPLDLVEVPEVDQPFEGDLDAFPLPEDLLDGPQQHINLVKHFLGSVPWYEWDPSSPTAWIMVRNYIVSLSKYPEYQLS
jgi:uncharacterized protein (DUF1800 family)